MALTPEQAQQLKATIGGTKGAGRVKKGKGDFFSGGFVSDVIDVLQLPQFIATGALAGDVTIGEAIKKRVTPSDVFKLTGLKGFLADVVLDPINFIGVGALTKAGKVALKGGQAAKTLGGAAKAGQRGLITVGLPFTDEAVSLGKALGLGKIEEKALGGVTKGVEALKRIPLGGEKQLGDVLATTFGSVPAARGAQTVEQIEKFAKQIGEGQDFVKSLERQFRKAAADSLDEIRPFATKVDDLLKKGKVTVDDMDEIGNVLESIKVGAKPNLDKLTAIQRELVKDAIPVVERMKRLVKKAGVDNLPGKGFTNVPKKGAIKKPSFGKGKKVVSEEGIEKTANFAKFGGKIGRQTTGTTAEIIETGQKLRKTTDGWVDIDDAEALSRIKNQRKVLSEEVTSINNSLKRAKNKQTIQSHQTVKESLLDKIKSLTKEEGSLSAKTLQRTGANAPEIEQVLAKVGEKSLFETDPLQRMFETLTQSRKAIQRKKAVATLKATANAGESSILKPVVGSIPDGYKRLNIKELTGYMAKAEVAEALEKTYFSYSSLGVLEDYLKGYNTVQNQIKKILTFVNPAFHSRNAVSNTWQQWLGGVHNPAHIAKGYEVMYKAAKAKKAGRKLSQALSKQEFGFYQEFVEEGLGGVGAFFGDIERQLKKQPWLFEQGGAVGAYLEDSAKMGMYINRRLKGFDKASAAKEVRKYLFDYSDLTDAERVIFKSAFPFYTWTRKNLPLQVATLIQKPGKVAVIGKAKKAVESMVEGEPMDEDLLPDWMREGYSVFVGQRPDGIKNYLKLEGFLPTIDLAKFGRPQELPLELMSPLIKTPIEILSNYDFFYERDIKEFEGQRKPVFGMDIPILSTPVGRKIFDLARPIKDIERALGFSELTKKEEDRTSKTERALRFILGVNIKGYDEKKQADVLDMLKNRDIGKIDKEIKEARKAGNQGAVDDLRIVRQLLESGEIKPKL